MVKTKQTMLAQLIAMAVIFALLLLGIFIVVPGLRYLFMLFIIANLALGFINGKRNLPANITFIILTPLLFIPILEYLITIILFILIGIFLVKFYLWYKDGGKQEKKKDKEKKKAGEKEEKTRWWSKWWIILLVILAGIVLLLMVMVLLFFSTTSMGVK